MECDELRTIVSWLFYYYYYDSSFSFLSIRTNHSMLSSMIYFPGGPPVWDPIAPFKRTDADVSLHFLAQTNVVYTRPVHDPLFSATTAMPMSDNLTMWLPDRNVSVLGCIDQYRICNSHHGACTPLSGVIALEDAITKIGLNDAQLATAFRLHNAAQRSPTWLNGFHLGADGMFSLSTSRTLYTNRPQHF